MSYSHGLRGYLPEEGLTVADTLEEEGSRLLAAFDHQSSSHYAPALNEKVYDYEGRYNILRLSGAALLMFVLTVYSILLLLASERRKRMVKNDIFSLDSSGSVIEQEHDEQSVGVFLKRVTESHVSESSTITHSEEEFTNGVLNSFGEEDIEVVLEAESMDMAKKCLPHERSLLSGVSGTDSSIPMTKSDMRLGSSLLCQTESSYVSASSSFGPKAHSTFSEETSIAAASRGFVPLDPSSLDSARHKSFFNSSMESSYSDQSGSDRSSEDNFGSTAHQSMHSGPSKEMDVSDKSPLIEIDSESVASSRGSKVSVAKSGHKEVPEKVKGETLADQVSTLENDAVEMALIDQSHATPRSLRQKVQDGCRNLVSRRLSLSNESNVLVQVVTQDNGSKADEKESKEHDVEASKDTTEESEESDDSSTDVGLLEQPKSVAWFPLRQKPTESSISASEGDFESLYSTATPLQRMESHQSSVDVDIVDASPSFAANSMQSSVDVEVLDTSLPSSSERAPESRFLVKVSGWLRRNQSKGRFFGRNHGQNNEDLPPGQDLDVVEEKVEEVLSSSPLSIGSTPERPTEAQDEKVQSPCHTSPRKADLSRPPVHPNTKRPNDSTPNESNSSVLDTSDRSESRQSRSLFKKASSSTRDSRKSSSSRGHSKKQQSGPDDRHDESSLAASTSNHGFSVDAATTYDEVTGMGSDVTSLLLRLSVSASSYRKEGSQQTVEGDVDVQSSSSETQPYFSMLSSQCERASQTTGSRCSQRRESSASREGRRGKQKTEKAEKATKTSYIPRALLATKSSEYDSECPSQVDMASTGGHSSHSGNEICFSIASGGWERSTVTGEKETALTEKRETVGEPKIQGEDGSPHNGCDHSRIKDVCEQLGVLSRPGTPNEHDARRSGKIESSDEQENGDQVSGQDGWIASIWQMLSREGPDLENGQIVPVTTEDASQLKEGRVNVERILMNYDHGALQLERMALQDRCCSPQEGMPISEASSSSSIVQRLERSDTNSFIDRFKSSRKQRKETSSFRSMVIDDSLAHDSISPDGFEMRPESPVKKVLSDMDIAIDTVCDFVSPRPESDLELEQDLPPDYPLNNVLAAVGMKSRRSKEAEDHDVFDIVCSAVGVDSFPEDERSGASLSIGHVSVVKRVPRQVQYTEWNTQERICDDISEVSDFDQSQRHHPRLKRRASAKGRNMVDIWHKELMKEIKDRWAAQASSERLSSRLSVIKNIKTRIECGNEPSSQDNVEGRTNAWIDSMKNGVKNGMPECHHVEPLSMGKSRSSSSYKTSALETMKDIAIPMPECRNDDFSQSREQPEARSSAWYGLPECRNEERALASPKPFTKSYSLPAAFERSLNRVAKIDRYGSPGNASGQDEMVKKSDDKTGSVVSTPLQEPRNESETSWFCTS